MDYLAYISKIKGSKVYLSEGEKLSNNSHLITSTRKKGGINGKRKSANEEWLNVFSEEETTSFEKETMLIKR